jgi:ribonuclease D
MLVKIFTLSFDSNCGGFGDEPVREFLKGKRVCHVSDYLVTVREKPYLVFVIQYEVLDHPVDKKSVTKQKWQEMLQESDMGVFNLLRDWRQERSKKEGVPPYIVFTNTQLAQIVRQKPQTVTDLSHISGIGKSKLKESVTKVAPTTEGLSWLGMRVFPGIIRCQRATLNRFRRKLRQKERDYLSGVITEAKLAESVQAMVAHISHANSTKLRQSIFG